MPLPFARIEDFTFSSHNSLLAPTSNMLALIDSSRPMTTSSGPVGWRLDEATSALLELELTHCVKAKSIAPEEPAGPLLRMALLWGRLSEVAADVEQRVRTQAIENDLYEKAVRALFLESDPNFGRFGYPYRWAATLILERFAETADLRDVAVKAWTTAAAAHHHTAAATSDRRVRKAHTEMAAIDQARIHAIDVARRRTIIGRADTVVSLRGHGVGERSRPV